MGLSNTPGDECCHAYGSLGLILSTLKPYVCVLTGTVYVLISQCVCPVLFVGLLLGCEGSRGARASDMWRY